MIEIVEIVHNTYSTCIIQSSKSSRRWEPSTNICRGLSLKLYISTFFYNTFYIKGWLHNYILWFVIQLKLDTIQLFFSKFSLFHILLRYIFEIDSISKTTQLYTMIFTPRIKLTSVTSFRDWIRNGSEITNVQVVWTQCWRWRQMRAHTRELWRRRRSTLLTTACDNSRGVKSLGKPSLFSYWGLRWGGECIQ